MRSHSTKRIVLHIAGKQGTQVEYRDKLHARSISKIVKNAYFPMKNHDPQRTGSALALSIFLALVAWGLAKPLFAEEKREISDIHFLMRYSDDFTAKTPHDKSVLGMLEHKTGGYPTVNVIRQAGPFADRRISPHEASQRILDSYQLVGLLDAAIRSHSDDGRFGVPTYYSSIAYQIAGKPLIADVWIFDLLDRHYILTMVDDPERHRDNAPVRNNLLNAVSILTGSGSAPPARSWSDIADDMLPWAASVATMLALIVWVARRARPH